MGDIEGIRPELAGDIGESSLPIVPLEALRDELVAPVIDFFEAADPTDAWEGLQGAS